MNEIQTLNEEINYGIANSSGQYLTFILASEEYGVDILRVQEIKGWDTVTPIPNTPEYLKGVINLRGTIVPIIDLRQRFDMDLLEYGPTTVTIILKIMSGEKERVMGIVVDAVSEVYNIPGNELQPAPDFGGVVSVEFVRGLASIDDKMLIILDIDKLCNADEMAVMESATGSTPVTE
jgi:purine-binding chemotaxis protein CheW